MAHIMDDWLARKTEAEYVCSACYGHLIMFFEPDNQIRIECHRCGADTPGFVTKAYANRRRSDSTVEKWEVEAMLENIGVVKKDKPGVDRLFKELGF